METLDRGESVSGEFEARKMKIKCEICHLTG